MLSTPQVVEDYVAAFQEVAPNATGHRAVTSACDSKERRRETLA